MARSFAEFQSYIDALQRKYHEGEEAKRKMQEFFPKVLCNRGRSEHNETGESVFQVQLTPFNRVWGEHGDEPWAWINALSKLEAEGVMTAFRKEPKP
jgi:hypothetical protein